MRRLAILIAIWAGTMMVWAAPVRQADLFELFILQARNDLELTANEALGEGVRPDSWTFNFDLTTNTFVADLWYDNEILAENVFGAGERPERWFGATTFDPFLLSRNIRHDLELVADAVFGAADQRPVGWNGAQPIYRCTRTIQNIIRYVEALYDVRPLTAQDEPNYCDQLRFEIEGELIRVSLSPIEGFDFGSLLERFIAVRGDLERTANEVLGVNERPADWIGFIEDSPSLQQDLNSDVELLANAIFQGLGRPSGWARYIPDSLAISFFNLRYNLETMTDEALGDGVRPSSWQGQDPTLRCEPLTQALSAILGDLFGFSPNRDVGERTTAEFCTAFNQQVNNYADNPPTEDFRELIDDPRDRVFAGEAEFAWAFLDVGALDYMGAMPPGTRFRAWYRNFQESTMMYVTGIDQDFGVFIDRRFTDLDADVFARLPTLDGVRPLTYCNASWCDGPGPTPTPRGGSAVERLVQGAGTAVPDVQTVEEVREVTGKTQVSWNHIRVTYLLDRPEANAVQVALEICAETAQINCEPVNSVLDQTLGVFKPVVGVFEGLNVYEVSYGYSTEVVVEGENFISPDIWISDPTLR